MTRQKPLIFLLPAVLLMLLLIALVQVVSGQDAKTDAKTDNKKDDRSLDRAIRLLDANRPAEARDIFVEIVGKDGENVDALNGLGVAMLRLKQIARAQQNFERAMKLEPTNRSVVNNLAAARLESGESMRAAKLLADFLAKRDAPLESPLDAELYWSLCVAIRQTPTRLQRGKIWEDSVRVRDAYARRLDEAVIGMRLFGQQWIPATELAEMELANRDIERELSQREVAAALIEEELRTARNVSDDTIRRTSAADPAGAAARDEAIEVVESAEQQLRLARGEIADLTKTLNVVSWPSEIATISVRARKPPALPDAGRGRANVATTRSTTRSTIADDVAGARIAAQAKERYATAFAITPTTVVTSALAVRGASDIRLMRGDGTTMPAVLIALDSTTDVALLAVASGSVSPMKLIESGKEMSEGGAQCVSFAKLDLRGPTPQMLAMNVVKADDGQFSLDAERSPRLSGGPILQEGDVVGFVMVEFGTYRLVPAKAIHGLLETLGQKAGGESDKELPSILLVVARHVSK